MGRIAPSRTRRTHPSRHLFYAFLIGAALTASGFLLARCEQSSSPRSARSTTTLVVNGSETLKPLIAACAEQMMLRRRDVDIIVQGGGTATGIAALLAGQIDLAMISRELTEAERQQPIASGASPQSYPVAIEAIAIVAHPKVPITDVSLMELQDLFDGTIPDWRRWGRGDQKVVVVGRAAGSGTAAVITEKVTAGRPLATGATLLGTHADVLAFVARTPGAIGYADAHLASREERVMRLAIRRTSGAPAYLPDPDTIERGEYWLSRTLALASVSGLSEIGRQLLTHCRSEHALIAASGFVPLPPNASSGRP